MSDIVKELREHNVALGFDDRIVTLFTEAADEIERLREELYEIKLAAAGGEDAPGAANMVRAKDVERWTKELWRRVRDGETEIDRLREALRQITQCDFQAWARDALDKNPNEQRKTLERIAQYDMQKIAIDALGEGKE
jgi:hypothetical protein